MLVKTSEALGSTVMFPYLLHLYIAGVSVVTFTCINAVLLLGH